MFAGRNRKRRWRMRFRASPSPRWRIVGTRATQMNGTLTAAQRRRYERDGILFPLRVLSTVEAQAYRTACDELELLLGGKPRTIDVRQMHLHFSWAYALATQPSILDAVESLLGPNLLIWATELFAKHASDSTVSVGWHQDVTYMRFDPAMT